MEMTTTSVILYLIIAIASVVVYLMRKNFNYWKRLGIPNEAPHFWYGNLSGFRTRKQFGEIMAEYYHKFKGTGPFAGIYLGQLPGAVLLEKETIKHILIKDFTNFTDRGFYFNEKYDPLTAHLFFVEGQKWRKLRTKLSPTFTSGKIKHMYPTLLKIAETMTDVLAKKVQEDNTVEVRDLLGRYTTDIMTSVGFGIDCASLTNTNDNFMKLGRKSLEVQRHNPLIMSFVDSFPALSRKLGIRVLPEDVHQFFMRTIKDMVQYREQHNIQRNDLLSNLMEMMKSEGDNSITIEELAAQVFIFFLAGFETSSSTMAYALYELAQQQDLQDKLRAEVTEVLGSHKSLDIPYESIMGMPYLDQVISETLRKYPTLPFLNRQAINDYVVPGHPKYVLKAGTPLVIPLLGIQRDPEYYPNPDHFDPERFAPEMVKQRDAMEWLPFGDGPRNCIGMRFGKLQSRLAVASMIYRFRFTVCDKTEIPLTFQPKPFLLCPKKLVYLNVEPIR